MKIILMNYADPRIEILDVPESMLSDDVESFLASHGYSLSNISWMAAPVEYIPVQYHNYKLDEDHGTEQHSVCHTRLFGASVSSAVSEVKRREQEDLISALRSKGKRTDRGNEWRFTIYEEPIVAAYDNDEPCDMRITSVLVDNEGFITVSAVAKDNIGDEHEICVDDIFAGHLEFVTDEIIRH